MVAKKFRVRAKGSSKNAMPKGGSSSINPTCSRFRDAARAQRIAARCPMIAADDRAEKELLEHVPMANISLTTEKGWNNRHDQHSSNEKGQADASIRATSAIMDQLPISKLTLLEDDKSQFDRKTAEELFDQLGQTFSVQNAPAWPMIIDKMALLVEKCGPTLLGPSFSRVMNTVAELRDRDDCTVVAENIDKLFAVAIRSMGMEALLSAVPLNIDVDSPVLPRDFRRSWLPPLLARNVSNDYLAFFTRTLLPMAARLHQRIPQLPELTRKLYMALERQLWAVLARCMAASPRDFHAVMPVLAPIMGAALNDRPDLRLTMLAATRSALHFDAQQGGVRLMERFARNFLPILFSIFTTTATDSQSDEHPQQFVLVDAESVRKSTLETIRLYVHQSLPPQLLSSYVALALQKLPNSDEKAIISNNSILPEQTPLLADLLVTFIRKALSADLEAIFEFAQLWIDHKFGRAQKKSYRILAEIYQRIEEPELEEFFARKSEFLQLLISKGISGVDRSVFPWRIAIYRSVISSFSDFSALSHFAGSINAEIVALFQQRNSRATRRQAALCLTEMTSALIRLGLTGDEEISASTALEPLLSKVFGEIKSAKSGDEPSFHCCLVALNILVQKHCRLLDATLIFQIIGHCSSAIRISSPSVRLLVIRILRLLTSKLQPFMFEQYKDLVVEAIFSQSIKDVTSRTRKANALLLERLLDRLPLETLLKSTGDKVVWQKMLKNTEKSKRRKQRKATRLLEDDGEDEWELDKGRQNRQSDDSASRVSSAISGSWLSAGARTAKADSVFDILGDTSDEEDADVDEEEKSKKKRADEKGGGRAVRRKHKSVASHLSVVIEEDEEDEMLDLLDQKSMLHRVSLVEKAKEKGNRTKGKKKDKKRRGGIKGEEEEEEMKREGPFRTNKEGKLLITDLDRKRSRKRSGSGRDGHGAEEEEEEMRGKRRRKRDEEGEGEEKSDE